MTLDVFDSRVLSGVVPGVPMDLKDVFVRLRHQLKRLDYYPTRVLL